MTDRRLNQKTLFRVSGKTRAGCIVIMALFLVACGGGGGGGSALPPTSGGATAGTSFADLNLAQAGHAATAAGRAADARPRPGSVTQSSNVRNGITVDRVTATAEYGAAGNRHSIRNGSSWSISTTDGNPVSIPGVSAPFSGQVLHKRVSGGALYVAAYSDIEAPTTRQTTGGDDGTRTLPLGTTVVSGNVNGSFGGYSDDSATVDGEAGHVRCTGGCTLTNGRATGGTWTFTPHRAPGAVSVSGVSGVTFTGTYDPNRTPGTYNGQSGYFRCLSLSTGCGRTTTNGRVTALEGDWIFVPAGGMTVNVPDTDYLSGGVWLIMPDGATSADDVVFGAFADGSDPYRQDNLQALQGTARYEGAATGVYSDRSGGDTELGYWDAAVALTADFGDPNGLGTISGLMTEIDVDDERVSGSLSLGAAPIGSSNNGFFEGQVSGTVLGSAYDGRWGGQFFGNGEADGRPGSVAGTLGGGSMDDAVNFVGAFGAHRQ